MSLEKATQLVDSLRLVVVAVHEQRSRLVIDTPLALAELCAEMRFLSQESLRVILLNTKQELIKVVSVSQGTLNDALAHRMKFLESISKRGLCGLLLNFQLLFILHSRIPANEGLPELVIEHLRSDLQ